LLAALDASQQSIAYHCWQSIAISISNRRLSKIAIRAVTPVRQLDNVQGKQWPRRPMRLRIDGSMFVIDRKICLAELSRSESR
jgi:hypothetical protein